MISANKREKWLTGWKEGISLVSHNVVKEGCAMRRFISISLITVVAVMTLVSGCSDDGPVNGTNRSPTASFVVTPESGTTDTTFGFDASGCSDVEDAVASLEVRWDWENDGTWDTGWSTTKTADHQYSTTGTKTIALEVRDTGGLTGQVTRQVEVTDPGCTWTTTYEDLFNSTTLSSDWIVSRGDTSVYSLDGEALAVDDSDVYTSGPVFLYADSLRADMTRITCQIRTEEMNGGVEMGIIMRASSPSEYYEFTLRGDGLSLIEVRSGEEYVLAHEPGFEMRDHETRIMICDFDNGKLTATVKDVSGGQLASLSATDSTPLPRGLAGFVGEIHGTEGEYLYFDSIKLEECK
jgi:hypothetical protein